MDLSIIERELNERAKDLLWEELETQIWLFERGASRLIARGLRSMYAIGRTDVELA
jgi:hypothetical protein